MWSVDEALFALGRVGGFELGRRYVWRGVRDANWHSRTSLTRHIAGLKHAPPSEDELRRLEGALVSRARSWGIGAHRGGLDSDQAVLASLQHHGAPTRLLDVTTNPLRALWFACKTTAAGEPQQSGAVLAFDVTAAQVLRTADHGAPSAWGSLANPQAWHYSQALETSATKRQAFLVEPTFPDDRMRAQEATFLASAVPDSPTVTGVDDIYIGVGQAPPGDKKLTRALSLGDRDRGRPLKLPFLAILIPPRIKQKTRQTLESGYLINESRLFPDLAGFATALQEGRVKLAPESDANVREGERESGP
ncbi:MAG: FRG domain-containing protein [Candidatus Nanopelagicales bacterium]|nr:FRG domain-containing protein [Candidatus Nanopelagicales bacterium]